MKKEWKDIGTIEARTTEECAELIFVIAKAQRFGWLNCYPIGSFETNADQALSEIEDVEYRLKELKKYLKGKKK